MKFKIAHCFKKGSLIKYKGAILLIENDSYIIKFGFKTLDMLNINATAVTAIPNYLMCFRGIPQFFVLLSTKNSTASALPSAMVWTDTAAPV